MHIEALQRHRINRATNFARNHDSETLTLENLADVACLSRYHFLRVFTDHCHETPIEYLSRMRLEQSVSNLIYLPGMSVTCVALEAGFSSSQAFSNAFRRRFGISPRSFRAKNRWYVKEFPKNQYVLSPVMSELPVLAPRVSEDRKVVLRAMPATRLAYIRYRGPYYHQSAGRLAAIAKLIEWAKLQGVWREETELICVCPDNPAVTPPQYCQYDVGIAVEDGVDQDDIVSIQNLPATTLATLKTTGSAIVAKEAWRWLISQWLPQSRMTIAGHTYYQICKPHAGGPGSMETEVQLCMPVSTDSANLAKPDPGTEPPRVQNLNADGVSHNVDP